MGLLPVSSHWLLWHPGAGTVNRSHEQQLSKDPEHCWLEAGRALALSFADPRAPARTCLLPHSSCPPLSVFHRPSVNLVLTFGPLPSELGITLTSNMKTINSSGTAYPLTGPLSNSTESACKNRGGHEHRVELQGPACLFPSAVQGLNTSASSE